MTEPLLSPAAPLALVLRTGRDPVPSRLVVAGELDLSTLALLVRALAEAESVAHGRLEVDLGGVTFADCAGVRPLVELTHRAASAGAEVTLVHPRAAVARVLAHLGVPRPRQPIQPANGRPPRAASRSVST